MVRCDRDVWAVRPPGQGAEIGEFSCRVAARKHQAVVSSRRAARRRRVSPGGRPWRPPPWPGAAAGRSGSRPGSRPASRCRAGARRFPARPSPGAGWGRTARRSGPPRLMPLRSSMAMKLRSTPARPSRRRVDDAGSPARRGGQAVEAAAQVFGRLDHVAGEFLHGVLARLVDLAVAAGADVGHLGLGAHPAVLASRPVPPPVRRCGRLAACISCSGVFGPSEAALSLAAVSGFIVSVSLLMARSVGLATRVRQAVGSVWRRRAFSIAVNGENIVAWLGQCRPARRRSRRASRLWVACRGGRISVRRARRREVFARNRLRLRSCRKFSIGARELGESRAPSGAKCRAGARCRGEVGRGGPPWGGPLPPTPSRKGRGTSGGLHADRFSASTITPTAGRSPARCSPPPG